MRMNANQETSGNRLVKIVRNRERFWVNNVRPLDGYLVGEVDNNLLFNNLEVGETIRLREEEIIEEYET